MHRFLIACKPSPYGIIRPPVYTAFSKAILADGLLGDAMRWLNDNVEDFQYQWQCIIPKRAYEFLAYFLVLGEDRDATLFTCFHSDLLRDAQTLYAAFLNEDSLNWYMRGMP